MTTRASAGLAVQDGPEEEAELTPARCASSGSRLAHLWGCGCVHTRLVCCIHNTASSYCQNEVGMRQRGDCVRRRLRFASREGCAQIRDRQRRQCGAVVVVGIEKRGPATNSLPILRNVAVDG